MKTLEKYRFRYKSDFTGFNEEVRRPGGIKGGQGGKREFPEFRNGRAFWPDGNEEHWDTWENPGDIWEVTTSTSTKHHFATFPDELPSRCIKAASKPGDWVLDPFAGIGTTGKVALREGRNCALIEIVPEFVKLIRKEDWFPKAGFKLKIK